MSGVESGRPRVCLLSQRSAASGRQADIVGRTDDDDEGMSA